MRKTAAILLLLIFWFNLFGYQHLLSFFHEKADNKLEALIDNNEYSDEELLELRVSLNMPYQNRFTDFERHYGQITIEGKTYNYVKRKIEGDVLVLKCIPNNTKDQLRAFAADITKSNSNNEGGSPVKSSVKIFSFECDESFFQPASPGFQEISGTYTSFNERIRTSLLIVPHQPPQAGYLS